MERRNCLVWNAALVVLAPPGGVASSVPENGLPASGAVAVSINAHASVVSLTLARDGLGDTDDGGKEGDAGDLHVED